MSLAKRWLPGGAFARGSVSPASLGTGHKSLVVALRDLDEAENLLTFAASLAMTSQLRLQLIHVRSPATWAETDDVLLVDDGQEIGFRLRSSQHLAALAQRWSRLVGGSIGVATRINSSLIPVLDQACRKGDEYVVVRQPSRSLLQRWWNDAAEQEVIGSNYPLFVVPNRNDARGAGQRRPIRRVLLVVDDRPESFDAISRALSLFGNSAEYHLLHVAPLRALGTLRPGQAGTTTAAGDDVVDLRNQAWFAMHQAREQIEAAGAQAEASLIFDSLAPGAAILSQAAIRDVDAIVMTRRPRELRFWRKSPWRQVAREACVPVLLCPQAS